MSLKNFLLPVLIILITGCATPNYVTCSDISIKHYTYKNEILGYCNSQDQTIERCKQRIQWEVASDYNATLNSFFYPYLQKASLADAKAKKGKSISFTSLHDRYINVSPFCQGLGNEIDQVLTNSTRNKLGQLFAIKNREFDSIALKPVKILSQQQKTKKNYTVHPPRDKLPACTHLYEKLNEQITFAETNTREFQFVLKQYNSLQCQ